MQIWSFRFVPEMSWRKRWNFFSRNTVFTTELAKRRPTMTTWGQGEPSIYWEIRLLGWTCWRATVAWPCELIELHGSDFSCVEALRDFYQRDILWGTRLALASVLRPFGVHLLEFILVGGLTHHNTHETYLIYPMRISCSFDYFWHSFGL